MKFCLRMMETVVLTFFPSHSQEKVKGQCNLDVAFSDAILSLKLEWYLCLFRATGSLVDHLND